MVVTEQREEDWRGPVPGARWVRGASITDWMPGPLSPLFETTFVPEVEIVMQDLCRELHVRIPRPFLAVIEGRLYLRGDSYLSPRMLLVPVTYLRWARRLERRWRDEWLPELRATTQRWEVDPRTLDDADLLRGVDELARAGARYWRAAYVPRFAGISEQLFTTICSLVARDDDPHVSVLLRGSADGDAAARTAPHLDFVYATADVVDMPRATPAIAAAAEAATAAATIRARLGPLRRSVFDRAWRWARRWAALREESMLSMGLAWPALRGLLTEHERRHDLGAGLACFLRRDELADPAPGAAAAAAARRALWKQRRRERAPLMLPAPFRMMGMDVQRFLAGGRSSVDDGVLRGVGVSPGIVTGRACVAFSPFEDIEMEPGDVLVAPLTNPAWTPLMSIASAIVTDTGGPLSHASIVAREFGIPAVVGTGDATVVTVHGGRITVDGDAGTVTPAPGPTVTRR
jgi:phosphohistidine swiveling domain-containing protein